MGEGGMGYVMLTGFAGLCVLGTWLFLTCVYALVVRLARLTGASRAALSLFFVVGAAIPPLYAKAWLDDFAEEENRLSIEREAREAG